LKEYQTFRLSTDQDDLTTYQQIPYHMVFDCKFDGRRKGRLVAGGNHTIVTSEQVYSGVVGIETIRTILALAAMDDRTQVVAADVSNAFLYGKNIERTMIKAGPEFGDLQGRYLIVEGGWYGHKTAAATFHAHLAERLRKMGFVPTKADLDLWIRRTQDGSYEYIASYVDDIIAISKDPMKLIEKLKETYSLKGVGTPEYYLGGNYDKIEDLELLARGINTAMSARTYIANSIEKFERMFGGPLRESKFPMIEGLHPESDTSQVLSSEMASQYRAIIGSLNWVVTLGRFDVMYATNTLARFSIMPRLGHLEATKRILGYLKRHPDYRILMNPNPIDLSAAIEKYTEYEGWREFYPEASEEVPNGMPVPTPDRKVQITVMVDADHAHCEVTRRSVTGILVFVNSTPVRWFSKMQKTVETSTYGSELVAARIATDIALELRYNIRMMGFAIDGPVNMFGDNQSVILSTTIPSSQLKKKIHACAYHRIREMITCKAIRFMHCQSVYNAADVLTKPLGGIIHRRLVEPILCGDDVPALFKREVVELG
jgi:Reverse transcriptase (RNA-dependent DNA polymerase)